MKFLALLFVLSGTPAFAGKSEVTPVQKVIQLLDEMIKKGVQEKHDEWVEFAAYKKFCEDTWAGKNKDIEKGEENIDIFKARIAKQTATIQKLTEELAAHTDDIDTWKADEVSTTKAREIEKGEYDATHKDYSESIDSLKRAIATLKAQDYDREQATTPCASDFGSHVGDHVCCGQSGFISKPSEICPDHKPYCHGYVRNVSMGVCKVKTIAQEANSLAQMHVAKLKELKLIPDEARAAINLYLSQQPIPDADTLKVDFAPPEANAYEFQSTSIVELLKKLQAKFIKERTVLEQNEASSKHAYTVLSQELAETIAHSESEVERKSNLKSKTMQDKANSEADLADATNTKTSDETYRTDLIATCEKKANDFESRQVLRADELIALKKALDIISGKSVSGVADKHLPGLLQGSKTIKVGEALAQVRGTIQIMEMKVLKEKAAQYLSLQGDHLGSKVLSALAVRVEGEPFKKVIKMIKDLIVRLGHEADEEASHKEWCDEELASSSQTRKTKTEDVERLTGEVDQLKTSIAKIADDIAFLKNALAELEQAMATATTIREAEKEKNEQTIEDAQEAQTAVSQAMSVLSTYYATAASATAFAQQPGRQLVAKDLFTGTDGHQDAYKGMQKENNGVMAALEVVDSDFARLESDTGVAENAAQSEYDQFMQDSNSDKNTKTNLLNTKTTKKETEENVLANKEEDLGGAQKALDAALYYYDQLRPSCVDAATDYATRVERRQSEIESLQQALIILNSDEIGRPGMR